MRLSRQAFEQVLKPPVIDWITPGQASLLVKAGAVLIDVRMPEEFSQRAIKGALNLPLYRLREDAATQIDRKARLIVYCNTGERSSAAAFILTRLGYEVFALQGGLSGMLKQVDQG